MRLSAVTYLARDYDEAIAWFRDALGFVLLEDLDQGGGKRWVRMGAAPDSETALLIARAVGPQAAQIGHSGGGRVAYFLDVDDFDASYQRMTSKGVIFEEDPRSEVYGKVAVFRDLYGNRWDLLQLNVTS